MEKIKTTKLTSKIEIVPVYKFNENSTIEEIAHEKKMVWDKIREVDKWVYRIANRLATEYWNIFYAYGNVRKSELPKIQPYDIYKNVLVLEFPELKSLKISAIANPICKQVHDKIKNEYYDYLNGKKTLPNYKSGYPIPIIRAPKAVEKDNRFYGLAKLLDKNNIDNIFTTPMGDFKLYFGRDRSNNKHIIDQCKEGVYKLLDSKIQYVKSKNKLFMLLTFEKPVDNTTILDRNKFLGVDLGVAIPIVASVYGDDNYSEYKNVTYIENSIKIGTIDSFLRERTKLQAQRRKLQTNLKFTKGGHGRKRKLKPLDNLKKREIDWVKNKNHEYSRALINFALKNNCGNIVLEDLSGFNDNEKNQKFIGRNWSYFQLQTMIKNKAIKHNIDVYMVDPRNTSKGCSFCDNVNNENRKSQSEFECTSCGVKINADLNATRNIVKKHLKNVELQPQLV